MLQKLAGRLTWERTGSGGIRVEIPTQFDWWAIPAAIFAAAWTAIPGVWLYQNNLGSEERLTRFAWTCAAVGAIGVCAALGWVMWTCTGKTIVNLDFCTLKIQRRIAGLELDTRSFVNSDVRNLRHIPPSYTWAFRTDTDPSTTKIQFEVKGSKIGFGRGTTERESCALIDRMIEIYSFPKGDEASHVGAAR